MTEIHYKFNDETFMGTDEFDIWFSETRGTRLTSDYDEEEVEAEPGVDDCVEDLTFDDKDLY